MAGHGKRVLRDGGALFELTVQPGEHLEHPLRFSGTHDAQTFLRRFARDALAMGTLRAALVAETVGLGGKRLDDVEVIALLADRLAKGWIRVAATRLPRLVGRDGEAEEEAVSAPPPPQERVWAGEEDVVEPPLWEGEDDVVEPPLWAGTESIVEPSVTAF